MSKLNNYKILYCDSLDAVQLIVLTELSFVDFDVDITGGASDVRKKVYHKFLLKFDVEESTLLVFSDIYSDIVQKFQKENFIRAIFTGR